MSRSPSARSRRALLVGGAGAAVAAAAVVLTEPAEAAALAPVLLGRGNAAGARTTAVTATLRGAAWQVTQRGAGVAAALYARATAVLGATSGANAWGAHGRNDAAATGTGGGVRAEGRRNAGLLADTTVQDVPAVVAIGGDGTGVAQVATGQSYLDGDSLALRAWTGVVSSDAAHVVYAPLVSAEAVLHTGGGHATLDGGGSAVVALPATFTAACDMTTLRVSLTAVGAAMPGLYVTYRQGAGAPGVYDGFTVGGGAAGGTVAWSAWAVRGAVDLAHLTASSAGAAAPGKAASAPGGDQPAAGPFVSPGAPVAPATSTRLTRRRVNLPGR
jgi:hypothetical protein